MRSRATALLIFVFSAAFVLPPLAHASIPFFGPIIPQGNNLNVCPADWGMVITVINNIISFALTIAIVFLAPLMIAYAGFLYVLSPTSAGDRRKANNILVNTIVGIVVALAAWLIVDAIMVVLTPNGQPFNMHWQALISSQGAPQCLPVAAALNPAQYQNPNVVTSVAQSGVQQLAPQPGDCSPTALQAAGISSSIASGMACIAQQESSCNLTAKNPGSSATGLFQVVFGYNDTGHNLDFPVCTQAAQRAGFSVSGNLDCHTAVLRGGAPNPAQITLYNACEAAASNASCNATAAQWLYDHNHGYSNWVTASKCGL